MLAWSVPGAAHAVTFWAFIVLGLTIVEAYGALFKADFGFGHWAAIGFVEDLFATGVLIALAHLHRDPVPQRAATQPAEHRASTGHTPAPRGRSSA